MSTTTPDTLPAAAIDDVLGRIATGAAQRERDGTRPFEQVGLVRDSGLGALRVPTEFGGAGADLRRFFDVLISLGAADPDVAQILRAHYGFGEVVRFLPDERARRRWFELFTGGSIIGNAVTERGPVQAGDFVGLATTFTPDGDGHVIDGVKYYSTGTRYADHVWVWGATPDPLPISAVVPVDRPGITITDDWDGFGQRSTASGTTRFAGVRAAADEVFASSADDPPAPRLTTGAFLQLYLTAVVAGIAQTRRDHHWSSAERGVAECASESPGTRT